MSACLKTFLLCGAALAFFSMPSLAQEQKPETPSTQSSTQPLEISADKALEWDRTNKKYYARGHAIAKQNDMQVEADTLTADYREGEKGTEIYRLTATGNVVLTSGTSKGYGDSAVYEVDSAKAVMTGKDLYIQTPEMKLTAQDKFEYYSNEGKMIAYGSPVITNKDSTLTADLITAWTADKKTDAAPAPSDPAAAPSQLKSLKRAEAEGHVVITTPKEKATAEKGIYTGDNDTVELLGNVKLNQGENILEGSRAEMNLTTKLSKMFASPEKGGRVKGTFFPSSQKSEKPAK